MTVSLGGETGEESGQMRSDQLRSHIQTQLSAHGTPLRWAITAIDPIHQIAHVEAVITIEGNDRLESDLRPDLKPHS